MALEFVLKLNDTMTPKLGASLRAADSAIAQSNQKAAKYAKSMGSSMDDARKKVEDLRAAANKSTDWRIYKDGMREAAKMEKQLDKLKDKAEGKGFMSKMLGGAGMQIVKPLLAAASVGAVMSFATTSVKAAMDFGATSKIYEVLAGNATKGRGLANELNKLQQDTILGPEVFKAGQTLMSFGVTVDKVMPYVKQLGDVSMGNTDRFNALTLAFSQTQSAGKLMGQDLLQYVNAGFNPLQTMSEKWKEFGFKSQMSVGQLRKAMEKGTITSAMVAKSFEIATSKGGKFADMMDTISQTSFGKMKVLEGQWENFKIQTGNALMPYAEGLMNAASKTLDWLNISKSAPEVLQTERGEVNSLVSTITALNQGNDYRAKLINKLVVQYPDFFGNIDKEKVKNGELLDILNKVNGAYDTRIKIASNQYALDNYKADKKEYTDKSQQFSLIAQLLRNGDVSAAKKNLGFFDFRYGARIRGDWSNEDNAKVFDNLSKEWGDYGAKTYDPSIKAKETQAAIDAKATKLESLHKYAKFDKWSKKDKQTFLSEQSNMDNVLRSDKWSVFDKSKGFGYDTSKLDNLINKYAPKGSANTAAEDAAKASAEKALSGQKTITINIARLGGVDKMDMHGAKMSEGFDEWEKKEKEMFLRVVNAAIGLANN